MGEDHDTQVDQHKPDERSEEQAAYEAALRQVEETMLNIESALKRAQRAEQTLRGSGTHVHFADAVKRTAESLNEVRRQLMQATYFAREEQATYVEQPPLDEELTPTVTEQRTFF